MGNSCNYNIKLYTISNVFSFIISMFKINIKYKITNNIIMFNTRQV